MAKRIFSTLVLWSLVFIVLWFFRATGAVLVLGLVSALTLREFYRLQVAVGYAPFTRLGMAFGAAITIAPWLEIHLGPPAHRLLALAILVFSVRILGERTAEKRVPALASTLFGLVYVAFLLQYLVRIVTPLPGDTVSSDGRLLLCVWLVAVAKLCDTGALLSGLAFGRHKMAPQISPKKTWEGAVGGVAVAIAVGAVGAWLGRGVFPAAMTPLHAALLAGPIAVVAIVSDLVKSAIKRQANTKDSGTSIPGIGGIFDLCDSLLLVAPVGYFLFGLR